MFFEIVIGICGLYFIASNVENALIRFGVLPNPLGEPPAKPRAVPAPVPSMADLHEAEMRKIEHRYRDIFIALPVAFWCDPNYWGDNPTWRDALPEPDVLVAENAPPCPRGCEAPVLVMAEHGGEPNLWSCTLCGTDYTRAGRSKRRHSRAARARYADRLEPALLHPPGMPGLEPAMVYGVNNPIPVVTIPEKLPCGCQAPGTLHHLQYGFVEISRCRSCGQEWEPPSNDRTKGRAIAQGEHVKRKGQIMRDYMWERRAERVFAGDAENHGSCPSLECGWPVDKRHGLYYCSNDECRHSKRGWR